MPQLSLFIVRNPYLSQDYLDYLIRALNRQSASDFNTLWLDQCTDGVLAERLEREAQFAWQVFPTQDLELAGVLCWELVHQFDFLLQQPSVAPYFTYLHLECLPAPDFIAQLLGTIPELEAQYGKRWVGMLTQWRCQLRPKQLNPEHFWEQIILLGELQTWKHKLSYADFCRYPFAYWEQPWEEDAFVMPTALAVELQLFSAVQQTLFFQDIFDIFPLLYKTRDEICPAVRWLRLGTVHLYHLMHPRPFLEFRREFLDAVADQPDVFGHLGWFELAQSELDYQESEQLRRHNDCPAALGKIYDMTRDAERGTVRLWFEAVYRACLQKA